MSQSHQFVSLKPRLLLYLLYYSSFKSYFNYLSMKSFLIISTRSYPISQSLNIYHRPCCSIMAICYTSVS